MGTEIPTTMAATEKVAAERCLHELLAGLWTRPGGHAANGIPWTHVIELAQATGVASSLYRALVRSDVAVPAAVGETLQQTY
jgi:hypothetical protein